MVSLLCCCFQLEGSNEVKLWNDIFVWAQQRVTKIFCFNYLCSFIFARISNLIKFACHLLFSLVCHWVLSRLVFLQKVSFVHLNLIKSCMNCGNILRVSTVACGITQHLQSVTLVCTIGYERQLFFDYPVHKKTTVLLDVEM